MKIKHLVLFVIAFLLSLPAFAQYQAVNGQCSVGGVHAVTQGLNSTNTLVGSYPQCTVTVFLTGTNTLATLFSNSTGTPLSNPFTAQTNGNWTYYAAPQTGFDVTMSGGIPIQFPSPITITNVDTGPVTGLVNNNVISLPSDTIPSIISRCALVSATNCTYVVTIPQSFTVLSNTTLPSNISVDFQSTGSWNTNGTGYTLLIAGHVYGTLGTHFTGNTPIKFGNLQSSVPVEWFGAIGDWNGSAGTDNTANIQKAINSVTSGQIVLQAETYAVSSALTITESNVGVRGTVPLLAAPFLFPTPTSASVIINTSASADTLDIFGTSLANNIVNARFEDFAVVRSVLPTGTATGFSLNYTYGMFINRVVSADSIRGFYIHSSGSNGVGRITNSVAEYGYNGLTEPAGNYYGWYLDSADGASNNSLRLEGASAFNGAGATPNIYGMYITGTAVNDLMNYGFETAQVNYGVYINYTGTGIPGTQTDLHFYGGIHDRCAISCYYISGLPLTGYSSVEINGGWAEDQSTTNATVDIENSGGVEVTGLQFGWGAPPLAVYINGGSTNNIHDNNFFMLGLNGIVINNSNSNIVHHNTLFANGVTTQYPIKLTNSTFNRLDGNIFHGAAVAGSAGIYLDATSISNSGMDDNNFGASFSSVAILDLASNPRFLVAPLICMADSFNCPLGATTPASGVPGFVMSNSTQTIGGMFGTGGNVILQAHTPGTTSTGGLVYVGGANRDDALSGQSIMLGGVGPSTGVDVGTSSAIVVDGNYTGHTPNNVCIGPNCTAGMNVPGAIFLDGAVTINSTSIGIVGIPTSGTTASTFAFPISFNGTTYYMRLSTTP